jgi:hypothetical protein
MNTISLGKVAVPAHGTPVKLADVLTAAGLSAELKVHRLHFSPNVGNTGKSYVGLSDTAQGRVSVFAATGDGLLRSFPLGSTASVPLIVEGMNNSVKVSDFAVDVQTDGEALDVFAEVV